MTRSRITMILHNQWISKLLSFFLVATAGEEGTKLRSSSSEDDPSDSESLCNKALTRASVLFLISLAVLSLTCRSVSLARLAGIKEHQQTLQAKQNRLKVNLKKAVVRQLVCLRWTNKERKDPNYPLVDQLW